MWAECKQFVPPNGTISLGNTCQRDKTTKHENIILQHASWIVVSFYSTIYLGNTVQRDKTTNFDNINEM